MRTFLLGRVASTQRWMMLSRAPSATRWFHASSATAAQRKVMKTFKLADIGEGITECEVLKWSVKPATKVEHFDILCEVQSDKATVEITSPFDGTVTKLLVGEGEIAKVGQGLCEMEVLEDEEHASQDDSVKETTPATDPAPKEEPAQKSEAAPVSPAPSSTTRVRRPHPLDPDRPAPSSQRASPTPIHPQTGSTSTPGYTKTTAYDSELEGKTLATPSVRHFARSQGIPLLSQLFPGSGKNGRIEKADVQKWVAGAGSGGSKGVAAEPKPGASVVGGAEQTIELGRTRWAMWKAMEQSLKIPHFGYSTILDLTNLAALLPTLNASIPAQYNPPKPSKYLPAVSPYSVLGTTPPSMESNPDTQYERMTFLPLLLKALSRAMEEWPLFRSSISFPAEESPSSKPSLTIRPNADIAIALSTPSGLFTPTIQAVNTKSAYDIMGELRSLSAKGRVVPHQLTPKEMPKKGATVTVSNVGAIGKGEFAAPLLVPGGGVAIVAIGRAKETAIGRLEVGVSWSADHRVVEGAEMAAFTETWRKWVEEPGLWAAAGR